MADPPTPAASDPRDEGGDVVTVGSGFPLRDRQEIADDPTGRLGAYLERTQNALDILALLTLWIVVVPVVDFGNDHGLRGFGLSFRLVLSAIYGVDMTIRVVLARHHWHYLRSHPLGVLAVIFPPVRVLFSLRLIRVLFRRGNLDRFLIAALFLLLNGSLIVWLFERDAAGSNIHTLGESVWWSIVTVTTVGYGDYYPVTIAGQVVATVIMFIGIVTVAVITAQVASSFVDQSAKRNVEDVSSATAGAGPSAPRPSPAPGPGPVAGDASEAPAVEPADRVTVPAVPAVPAVTLEELDARLSRIEQLLVSLQPPAGGNPASGTPG